MVKEIKNLGKQFSSNVILAICIDYAFAKYYQNETIPPWVVALDEVKSLFPELKTIDISRTLLSYSGDKTIWQSAYAGSHLTPFGNKTSAHVLAKLLS